jgi:hypothetical protein
LILGVPVWIFAVVGAVLVAIAGFTLWIGRKTSPFGYIVDDADRVVVDFSRLNRSILRRLFSKSSVDASEVADLPFEGGVFSFSGDGVKLVHKRAIGDPSMRVNSRPVGRETDMGENVWLGVGGRLLTFQLESRKSVREGSTESGSSIVGDVAPAPSPAD